MHECRIIAYDSDEYHKAVALRERVLRTPLGLSTRPEDVMHDHAQIHMAAFDGPLLIACISATMIDDRKAKLRQMAVAPDYHGKGIGTLLLAFAEQHMQERGCNEITLHARASAEGFYAASGYLAEEGYFTEVGIPHIRMRKPI